MPIDFLTVHQRDNYGRFIDEPDDVQLACYFHLDETDIDFVNNCRGEHNRFGIALQLGCVRFLGIFLTDLLTIPSSVKQFVAHQLGIADTSILCEYGKRENTRREHAALIRAKYQYQEFIWPWTF